MAVCDNERHIHIYHMKKQKVTNCLWLFCGLLSLLTIVYVL